MDQSANTKPDEPAKAQGPTEDFQLLRAFQSMFGVVPHLAGAVMGIVAIGYFVGWKTASAYYDAFGAEWVTSLLSPSELLQRSYTVLSGIITGLLGTMLYAVDGTWKKKWIEGADIVTSVLGVLLLCVAFGLDGCVRPTKAVPVAMAASFLLSSSISFSVAVHAYAIRDKDRKIGARSLRIVYLLWCFAAYQIPMLSGKPQGQLAADPETSSLPVVSVGGETWRLLLARPERLVLARLEKGKRPVIRFVPVEKVERIQGSSGPKEPSLAPRSSDRVLDAGLDVL